MDAIRFYTARFWHRLQWSTKTRYWHIRSRSRLIWRAISGKPMVVVRGSMVVDGADIHGGVWFDKGAKAEITNCLIQDGPQYRIYLKV